MILFALHSVRVLFFSSVTCLPQNEVLNTHVFGSLLHKFLKCVVWTDSVFIPQYTLFIVFFHQSLVCPKMKFRTLSRRQPHSPDANHCPLMQFRLVGLLELHNEVGSQTMWALNGNWIGNPLVPSAAPWPSDPVSPINIIYAAEHFILCTKCIHDNLKPKEVAKLILILQIH